MDVLIERMPIQKNPDDYFSRKAAREEEEKQEKHRQQRRASTTSDRRSVSGTPDSIKRRSANNTPEYKRRYDSNEHNANKRRSYIERNDEATQAAREYRMKRRSLHLEHERGKIEETKSQANGKQRNKSRSTELLSSRPSNRADKQTTKKSPAPLPPARSHPNISSSSPQATKKDWEQPQESQLEERANSEPLLDKPDFMNGLTVKAVELVHTRSSISEDEPLLASTPLEPRSLQSPTSPTEKSPPRPSVKKTRAPPPPTALPINPAISNKPNPAQSTPEDSLSPSSNISVDSINLAEVQKQEKLSRLARESQSLISPSASLTPDSLSPTATPNQSPFGSSDTLGATRNSIQPKTTSQADYLSPDSLSPTSTVSPPLSPLNPPVRPPRKKKKNANKQAPSSNISTSSDSGIGRSEEKKSLNSTLADQERSSDSLNKSNPVLNGDKTKAERPSSLIMENTTQDTRVVHDQVKKNNNTSPRISSEESETPVPMKRETSTKKKSAPPPPPQAKSESGSENTPTDSSPQDRMNTSTTASRVDIKLQDDFNHVDTFSDADEQLTPRANADSPNKESSVGLKPKPMAYDRVSITSFDSVDSVPPPLPNSAPPPLPSGGPPTTDILSSPDEIVEIEYTVPSHVPAVDSNQEKTHHQDNHVAARDFNENSLDSSTEISSLPVFSSMKKDNLRSETSPSEYFEGDSGIMTSLPTSPDEIEARVVSHKLKSSSDTKHQSRDTVSSIDSQFSETNVTSPFDYETKRSLFEEKDTSSSTTTRTISPTSPTSSSDGMMSPKSRKYDGKEIVERARQFAEMVQKPSFTAKTKSQDSDEFNQETLQEFELNRRSVISESTVRKKNVSSSLETEPKLSQEAEELPVRNTETKTPAVRHWDVKTTPEKTRVADTGWNSGKGERSAIYSQNVVQEIETTDVVDRESISDSIHHTKRQWEGVFRDHIDNQLKEPKEKPKSTVRHWEVTLPNQVVPRDIIKQEDVKLSHNNNNMSDVESAIDREIRLANEREELLKREQEERLQQNGKVDISSFEQSPPASKPLYHEMTEADRGSEMIQRETLIQQELREQEERELALKRKNLIPVVRPSQEKETSNENPNESIIQREIRLQKEREEELEKQRVRKETTVVESPVTSPSASKQEDGGLPNGGNSNNNNNNDNSVQNDINHNEQKVNVSYEDAISGFQHEGESRIARELRELREREEEIRRQREVFQNNNNKQSKPNEEQNTTPPSKSPSSQSMANSSSSSSISTKQGTWQKDVSPYIQKHNRSNSVDSLASSQSTGRTPSDYTPSREVKVMPNVQDDSDDESTPRYTPTTETPIQREIRLARERENELRRSKGMPEIEAPAESTPSKPPPTSTEIENTPPRSYSSSPRGRPDKSGHAMRSYATNRLQQELSTQRERELLYRKEGRIITTSEEHIEPMKYKEVTGSDHMDGPVKRNFQITSASASKPPQTPVAKSPDDTLQKSRPATQEPVKPAASPVKAVKSGSGASFSYKESRQTAESKIERELREMREREQELRKRNNPNCEEDEPESPTDTSFTKTSILGSDGQKQSLADRWQQVCGN